MIVPTALIVSTQRHKFPVDKKIQVKYLTKAKHFGSDQVQRVLDSLPPPLTQGFNHGTLNQRSYLPMEIYYILFDADCVPLQTSLLWFVDKTVCKWLIDNQDS
jgi:hypothetical protein